MDKQPKTWFKHNPFVLRFEKLCSKFPPFLCASHFVKSERAWKMSRIYGCLHLLWVTIASYSAKGDLISESFSIWLQSPRKCTWENYPEHILFYMDKAQESFWHIFWEIGAKLRNFPKLSHLLADQMKYAQNCWSIT